MAPSASRLDKAPYTVRGPCFVTFAQFAVIYAKLEAVPEPVE